MTTPNPIHYFDQAVADPRDVWLNEAIRQGRVPSTCLQLGTNVMLAVGKNVDPCAPCWCNRAKCGGREPTILKEHDLMFLMRKD